MRRLLIVYGTTEGQTRKIAEHVAGGVAGWTVTLHDATALPADLDPAAYDAVIVAASLHVGRHQTAVEHFVRRHRTALAASRTAFLSVSLSAAGDEHDRQDAHDCAERFLSETGWRPDALHLVAGAFRFTEYDFFKRWIMRRIAREKGTPTDTSRDWELTDWTDLDRFMAGFLHTAIP